jgi:uncharacterized OsmC-like protein
MASDAIRSAIDAATEHLVQHPEEARSSDSAATAVLVDGLLVRASGPHGATVTTDMAPSLGGTASAPSADWLLRAAEASCVVTMIAIRAAMQGITLDMLEVTVVSESDSRGLLGIEDDVPAGPLSGQVAVRLTAEGADPTLLQEIARWGVKHCPVCDALERPIPVTTEVSTA